MIEAGAPVRVAAGLMARPHVDLLIVNEGAAMIGVVTKTDIVAHISCGLGLALEDPVEIVMTRDVAYCSPSDPLPDVWRVMKERGFQRIPVVDDLRAPIGVVYARDVLQGLLREVEIEDELLRDYISGVGYH
jgi:CBS domain-containing protein